MYKKEACLHIALAELAVSWEDKEKNREKCERMARAAAGYADILIFPEMTLTGFSMNVEKIAEEKEDSPTLQFFMELSEKYQMAVAFGMAEYAKEDLQISEPQKKISEKMKTGIVKARNKCYLVSGRKILLEYAKLHPFSFGEESNYYQGGDTLAVTQMNGIGISPFICYDLRFPEPFQMVSGQADFIFVIANWPLAREEHWSILLKARAIENQCYVAGINRCGNDPALSYPEATAVYDPYGNRIEVRQELQEDADGKNGMENGKTDVAGNLYFAEIDKHMVETYRSEFPLKKDRREEFYGGNHRVICRSL